MLTAIKNYIENGLGLFGLFTTSSHFGIVQISDVPYSDVDCFQELVDYHKNSKKFTLLDQKILIGRFVPTVNVYGTGSLFKQLTKFRVILITGRLSI